MCLVGGLIPVGGFGNLTQLTSLFADTTRLMTFIIPLVGKSRKALFPLNWESFLRGFHSISRSHRRTFAICNPVVSDDNSFASSSIGGIYTREYTVTHGRRETCSS
jgi:hypothetical protein